MPDKFHVLEMYKLVGEIMQSIKLSISSLLICNIS
jgi:hypothetical protein